MIGSLRGRLAGRSLARSEVVVEVGGVGYRVTVAPRLVAGLGVVGADITVHTHLHVREDAMILFGFASVAERDCFEALVGARGVGPALGLAILGVHSPGDLRRILDDGDLDALTLVPGVGRKTAARLAIELKGRLDGVDDGGPGAESNGARPAEAAAAGDGSPPGARTEVRAALAALGYGPDEVAGAVRQLPAEGEAPELLRAALRHLAAAR